MDTPDIELLESVVIRRAINCISPEGMQLMFRDVPESVKIYARGLRDQKQWKFYAVNQSRGRCFFDSKTITIPMFAINRGIDYKTWYISHELSHAFAGAHANHGPEFMRWLKQICPKDCVHFELGYKPRNAAAAGIRKPGDIDSFDLLG
jgi:hypothetical protein